VFSHNTFFFVPPPLSQVVPPPAQFFTRGCFTSRKPRVWAPPRGVFSPLKRGFSSQHNGCGRNNITTRFPPGVKKTPVGGPPAFFDTCPKNPKSFFPPGYLPQPRGSKSPKKENPTESFTGETCLTPGPSLPIRPLGFYKTLTF